jgi:hypothetical protein
MTARFRSELSPQYPSQHLQSFRDQQQQLLQEMLRSSPEHQPSPPSETIVGSDTGGSRYDPYANVYHPPLLPQQQQQQQQQPVSLPMAPHLSNFGVWTGPHSRIPMATTTTATTNVLPSPNSADVLPMTEPLYPQAQLAPQLQQPWYPVSVAPLHDVRDPVALEQSLQQQRARQMYFLQQLHQSPPAHTQPLRQQQQPRPPPMEMMAARQPHHDDNDHFMDAIDAVLGPLQTYPDDTLEPYPTHGEPVTTVQSTTSINTTTASTETHPFDPRLLRFFNQQLLEQQLHHQPYEPSEDDEEEQKLPSGRRT